MLLLVSHEYFPAFFVAHFLLIIGSSFLLGFVPAQPSLVLALSLASWCRYLSPLHLWHYFCMTQPPFFGMYSFCPAMDPFYHHGRNFQNYQALWVENPLSFLFPFAQILIFEWFADSLHSLLHTKNAIPGIACWVILFQHFFHLFFADNHFLATWVDLLLRTFVFGFFRCQLLTI